MARGKTHDRINLIIGSVFTGALIGLERNYLVVAGFVAGFLLSTLVVSPDLDIGPKKRTRWLQFFLYPYSIFFRHRGHSHSILFGTLTRVLYGILVFFAIVFILSKMGYIPIGAKDFFHIALDFLLSYDYSLVSYKFLTWTYLGMFLADLLHIFIDRISSAWGRFRRKLL